MTRRSGAVALTTAEQERAREVATLLAGRQVDALVARLGEPSWAVRRDVVRALGELGQAAVPALVEALRSRRDDEARIAATVDALVANSGDVLPAIAPLADEPDPAVVADVAQVLGRRGTPRSLERLAPLAAHADDNVAVAAIEGLGRIGSPAAIDALIGAARSNNFFRVFPAIDVLGRLGDARAIPALAELAGDQLHQLEAARALGRTGESAAVGPLAKLLSHPSESVSRVAALALAELEQVHRERYGTDEAVHAALKASRIEASATQRLSRALSTARADEQIALASLLGSIGAEDAAAALRPLLDVGGETPVAAAAALKRLGAQADGVVRGALADGSSARRLVLLPTVQRSSALAEVIGCLDDEDASVRAAACTALGRMAAVDALPELFEQLADPNRRVVQAATAAIQSLGSTRAQRLALETAGDVRPAVRRSAIQILGYFGFPEALPVLVTALADDDVTIREAALQGLALFEDPAAVDAVLGASHDTQDKVRSAAMRALGNSVLREDRIEVRLREGLSDVNAWVRYFATQALGRREDEASAEAIAALLEDPAGQVRVAAVEALSHLQSPHAQKALRDAATNPDVEMQRAAVIGLGLSKHPESVRMLIAAATSDSAPTRLLALSALAEHAPDSALAVLHRALDDADEDVASAAAGFLGTLPLAGATLALIGLAQKAGWRDRALALLSQPAPHRVAQLTRSLLGADDSLAPMLAASLSRLRDADARDGLLHVLSKGTIAARKAAAAALAASREPRALAEVAAVADTDVDAGVRQLCSILVSR